MTSIPPRKFKVRSNRLGQIKVEGPESKKWIDKRPKIGRSAEIDSPKIKKADRISQNFNIFKTFIF